MDQDRREALAWAQEWKIRRKNRRMIIIFGSVAAVLVFILVAGQISTLLTRSTFGSAEEMREAMQGRYSYDRYYEDVVIEGDDLTLTYWSYSHYDRDYAEKYGYDAEEDSVYKDRVVKWDYRHGIMKTEWMGDFYVDKDGNLLRGKYNIFYKTNAPRPDPIDPSTLGSTSEGADAITDTEEEIIQEREESIEETQEAAEEAGAIGILPENQSD